VRGEKALSVDANFAIVCVSRQDWHTPLPTNRQQIMVRAARRGHPVLFVETGGQLGRHAWSLLARPERASLARRLLTTEDVAPGIRVRKALTPAPWSQGSRGASAVNARLTAPLIRALGRRLGAPVVLWLYDPCAFDLIGACGEELAVYDCVDDYAEQVGANARRRRFVAEADAEVARRAGLVFATTDGLFERQRRRNVNTHLVPNGADYDHFASVGEGSEAPEALALGRPLVGFAGNLTLEKVDFALLERFTEARPSWTIALVGPADARARPAVERLASRPNVAWLGPKPYEDLPRYVAAFDVGLIPYRSNAYTRNCSPLKVYEYLAAGKPVVATGVPSLSSMEPDIVLTDGAEGFAAAVEDALAPSQNGAIARRRALAARNTWETRAERLLQLVSERLEA
jgi:glycosyltransferase involved in cell wall biosynthesis